MNHSQLGSYSPILQSNKQLTRSQYQENKNIPSSNPVRKIQYDQPASIHLMKPKVDPSQQIYYFANITPQQSNPNNNSSYMTYQSNPPVTASKSPISKSRQVTPSRTPLRNNNQQSTPSNNGQSAYYNTNNSQLPTNNENLDSINNNMSQLLERVDNLEQQFEQEKRQSRYVSSSKYQSQPQQEQERVKHSKNKNNNSGFFSCVSQTHDETPQQQANLNDDSTQIRYLESEVMNLKHERKAIQQEHEQEVKSLRNDLYILQQQVEELKVSKMQKGVNEEIDQQNLYKLLELEKKNQEQIQQLLQQRDLEINKLKQVIAQQNGDLGQKLNEMTSRNAELQKQNIELAQRLQEMANIGQQIDYLNDQLKKKNQEVQTLKQNNAQLEEQVQLLQKINDSLKSNQENNQKFKEIEQHCLVLAGELDKMNQLISQKNQEVQALQNLSELKNKEIQNTKNENIILMEKIGNQSNRIKQLEKELFEQGNKMKMYSDELDKLQTAIQTQTNDTMRVNEKIIKENGQLQNAISELKIQINKYEAEQIRLQGVNQQLTIVAQSQEQKIKELEEQEYLNQDSQRQIKDLQNQISQKNNEIALKESTIKLLNDKLNDLEAKNRQKVDDLTQQYQSLIRDSDKTQEIQTLQKQIFDLKNYQQKLLEDNTKLAFELDQLAKNQQQEINKQLEQLERNLMAQNIKEKEQLLSQLNSVRNQLQIEMEKNRELQSEMSLNEQVKKSKIQQNEDLVKKEKENLENQIKILNADKFDSDLKIKNLERDNNELTNALKQSDQIIQVLQNSMEESKKHTSHQQKQDQELKKSEEEKKKLQQENDNLKKEIDLLRQQINQLNNTIAYNEQEKKRLSQDLEYKQNELQRLQQKYRDMENELNSKLIDAQNAIEQNKRDYQDIDDLLIEHNAEKTSLETHILKLKSQVNELEQEVIRLTQENKILAAQGVERLNMIENWKKSNSTQPIYGGVNGELNQKIQTLEENLLKETHQKASLQNQLVKYEEDLKNREKEVTELYKLIEKRKNEQVGQKSISEEVKAENEKLREKLKQAEAENLIKTEYYDRWLLENDELRRQVNYYKEQLKNVEESIRVKSMQIDENLSEVKHLKSKYEEVINESKSHNSLSPYSFLRKENQNSFINADKEQNQPFISNKSSILDQGGNKHFLSNYIINDFNSAFTTPNNGSIVNTINNPQSNASNPTYSNVSTNNYNSNPINIQTNIQTPNSDANKNNEINSPFTANLNSDYKMKPQNFAQESEKRSPISIYDYSSAATTTAAASGPATGFATTKSSSNNLLQPGEVQRQRYNSSYEPTQPQYKNTNIKLNYDAYKFQ
ncbi:hypothetical protein TTHERM_00467960 (macronuclear) [Tetrahymena thermophila SB210]|uniref:Uncharacterized protein n=1 Tax=Tetrahymena thermophila (strain SB210) TaxID=312017 RepID=I7MAL8_TETTS|nr:hypothetical protein TTHERM_00467960 [Tetrahymena thermophila SB210]EAS04846.3 hypothetical protein TTHERM_00467960 [Tetrahymena thermophila SB210]|eukprot:XP_001025091.3 hypothetical protein TTHERM_00467960 [Tetrahymena thermophila SB210]